MSIIKSTFTVYKLFSGYRLSGAYMFVKEMSLMFIWSWLILISVTDQRVIKYDDDCCEIDPFLSNNDTGKIFL